MPSSLQAGQYLKVATTKAEHRAKTTFVLLQGELKHAGSSYTVQAGTPVHAPPQAMQRQEYMRHALQMDSASY